MDNSGSLEGLLGGNTLTVTEEEENKHGRPCAPISTCFPSAGHVTTEAANL